MADVKHSIKKSLDQLKNTVWLSGKLVKITQPTTEGGPQVWKVYAGLAISYTVVVPEEVFRNRQVFVEDAVRVFSMPGRTKMRPYTAVDFEVRKSP